MAIEIGFATWTMGDAPLYDYLPTLADMGYDGIELATNSSLFTVEEVRPALEESRLAVYAVTAPLDLDLAHPLPSLRHRSIDEARRTIEYTVSLGCHRLVLREKAGRMRPIVGRAKEWALLQDSLRTLTQSAAQWGVDLCLLAVNRYEGFLVNTAEDAMKTIGQVGASHIMVALNTYHMHMEEDDLRAAIEHTENHLGLFYAAENHRRALGAGQIDWVDVCQTLNRMGYQGPMIVECQATGADPFLPVGRSPEWQAEVLNWAEASIQHLRVALAATCL